MSKKGDGAHEYRQAVVPQALEQRAPVLQEEPFLLVTHPWATPYPVLQALCQLMSQASVVFLAVELTGLLGLGEKSKYKQNTKVVYTCNPSTLEAEAGELPQV